MTVCEACDAELEFDADARLLFCPNEDCEQFGNYEEIITCLDCGELAALNPAQRCDDCQRQVMRKKRSTYFPERQKS